MKGSFHLLKTLLIEGLYSDSFLNRVYHTPESAAN